MPKELVPISQMNDRFTNIELGGAPPFRQNLFVDVDALTGSLKTVHADGDVLRLSFLRDQPNISIASTKPGTAEPITANPTVKKEKTRYRPVRFLADGSIAMTMVYDEKKAQNPQQTAQITSNLLDHALGTVPWAKYVNSLMTDENVLNESASFTTQMLLATLGSPIVATLIANATHTAAHFETFLPASFIGLYLYVSFYQMQNLRDYKKGKMLSATKQELAKTILENPRRLFYPATFVDECLVPTVLYQISAVARPNMIVYSA